MEGNSLLAVPSNVEAPLMCEVPGLQQGGAGCSSGSGLGSSITARKKVLRSNSLLESTDYWMQNQRTPCQIGFVEDKSENCASVCFVNLDVNKNEGNHEHLQQKLVNVSPDLPKLINSMNVQQPKENEIVLLSGLTSGSLQADFEVSQCSWLPDICLVQCARGNRHNSTNCIIFEINKFLIGLELVQKRQLHPDTSILKVEDDTNCSLSSIEEDFLTASEYLEEESEVEEGRNNGYENMNISASLPESEQGGSTRGEWCDKAKPFYPPEDKSLSKSPTPLLRTEDSLAKLTQDAALHDLDLSGTPSERKGEAVDLETAVSSYYCPEACQGTMPTACCAPGGAVCPKMAMRDDPSGVASEPGWGLEPEDRGCRRNPAAPTVDGDATTGDYATNLAESVLQDAFIRLSQPARPQASALSAAVRGTQLPPGTSTRELGTPRSWNELPKIVIVQSPDGGSLAPDPGLPSWPEPEGGPAKSSAAPSADKASRPLQSTLEVALACAATVIGTISSPQATERLKREHESPVGCHALASEPPPRPTPPGFQDPSVGEYSFPSALCGMTQVASAVAVCGLGDAGEVASNAFPPAAETPVAFSVLGGSPSGGGLELGPEAMAEALLREMALVLTTPHTYGSLGHLVDSVTRTVVDTASRPQPACAENVPGNELAQTLSSIILKHSVDQVHQQSKVIGCTDERPSSETLDSLMEMTHRLLFGVICSTFKKMRRIVQLGECATALAKEPVGWRDAERGGQSPAPAARPEGTKATTEPCSGPALSGPRGPGPAPLDPVPDPPPRLEDKGQGNPRSPKLPADVPCGASGPESPAAGLSPTDTHLQGGATEDAPKPLPHRRPSHHSGRGSAEGERTPPGDACSGRSPGAEGCSPPSSPQQPPGAWPVPSEGPGGLAAQGEDQPGAAPSPLRARQAAELRSVADFAEELAGTIVSMATEIAAICLDNAHGNLPWFCAWRRGGGEFPGAPSAAGRTPKRKKDCAPGSSAPRKHKPPRLGEIKRKTDEHPELKEKLMNRVVDESVNLDDVPGAFSAFADEVAARILTLTEVDGGWHAQGCPRGRLLSGDRWSRLKASSCESIPEEDPRARARGSERGLASTLSPAASRASSVSKQSSCESVSEEFSRFMVSQMESEGRGFELLLDYYAGQHAGRIVSAAVQQAGRQGDPAGGARPACASKQSSTESITEDFYRYMLRAAEREAGAAAGSRRGSQDWGAGLLPPTPPPPPPRSPLCQRQSSAPDARAVGARLMVSAPVKASSLDGCAHGGPRDLLSVQPVGSSPASGLCKSDSCLYRRGGPDQVTSRLIHETWASSIEALMRKNKIIGEHAGLGGPEAGAGWLKARGAGPRVPARAQSGPGCRQESADFARRDSVTEGSLPPGASPSGAGPLRSPRSLDAKRGSFSCGEASPPRRSLCPRDVPLIQIEADQREECVVGEPGGFSCQSSPPPGQAEELQEEETGSKAAGGGGEVVHACQTRSDSLQARDAPEAEVALEADITPEGRDPEEPPNPPGSSEESTDSWSQLANEEDNPDDTSSFLQLSERSMSNGNSSATSSLGIMDLDIYQESMPSSPMINELVEEKEILNGQSETVEEPVPGLTVGAAGHQASLLVINFDLEPGCPDAELRATLQWIAASELGIPTIYFKKSQESRIEKFLDVVRLVHQKSWKVGDIFHAIVQYCKMHEEQKEVTPSLFDWLLELG